MSARHQEHDTLDAIQELQDKYPFATALLIYCLIERIVKYFVIKERINPRPILDKSWCLSLKGMNDDDLYEHLINTNITFGRLARKFNSKVNRRTFKGIADRRNKYMHSKDLFPPLVNINTEKRSKIHKADLLKAIKDLKTTLNRLKDTHELEVDQNGKICGFHLR
jgi:hypothetical protein